MAAQYESSEAEAEKEHTKNKPAQASGSVTQGSSNANFKKTANDVGDRTAKAFATAAVSGVMRATVGRVPIAGPILSGVASQIVREEMEKVRLVNESSSTANEDPVKETSETTNTPIQESMYQSAIESQDESDRKSLDRVSMSSGEHHILDREDHYGGNDEDDQGSGPQWVWLTLGSCKLDPNHLPGAWLTEQTSSQLSLAGEAWRVNILQVMEKIRKKSFF